MQSEKGCPVCGNGATVQASTAVASMSENPQPAVKADGSPAPIQRVAQLSGTASEAPGNAQGSALCGLDTSASASAGSFAHAAQIGREKERQRIARDFHDDIGQLVTVLKLDLKRVLDHVPPEQTQLLAPLQGLDSRMDDLLASVQRIVSDLNVMDFGALGLCAAIRSQLDGFAASTDISCELSVPDQDIELSKDEGAVVIRILREALTNVARHAGASRVTVEIKLDGDELLLDINDSGRGIEDAALAARRGNGVSGMRERAQLLHGDLKITRGFEGGTRVMLRMPAGRSLNGRLIERRMGQDRRGLCCEKHIDVDITI